jgi:hypothetical protein
MDRREDSAWYFSRSTCCSMPLQYNRLWSISTNPQPLSLEKCYHRVLTTNVCVNRIPIQKEVILKRYAKDQGRFLCQENTETKGGDCEEVCW